MAATQQEVALHNLNATDLKQFIQVLTPLSNSNDEELKKLSTAKLKELIPQIKLFEEKPIKSII